MRREEELSITGKIANPQEGSLTNIQYWNPLTGNAQNTAPSFPVDHFGGLYCRGVNNTGAAVNTAMYFEAYNPNGKMVKNWMTQTFNLKPNEGFSASFSFYCDIPGSYRVTCLLIMDYYGNVDFVDVIAAYATAAPAADARLDTWWYWDATKTKWVDTSPTLIPLNSDIGLRVRARNISNVELNIRADVQYISPSGIVKTLKGNVQAAPYGLFPADYPLWDFLWEATEMGDWRANIIIYAGLPGGSLKEVDSRGNIYVANVSTYAPPTPPDGEVPEVYRGTISKKELEYDGSRKSIPASDILVGVRGLVHIWGRNDTTSAQRMGISWAVYDPLGQVVEQYSAWEDWPYTPEGKAHEFIGGRFQLSSEGEYSIGVSLFMNPKSPTIVDTYSGRLCMVSAVVPPPGPPGPPPPGPEPEPPEEEVKFPWLPVALIGGGAVVVAAAAAKPKKGKA